METYWIIMKNNEQIKYKKIEEFQSIIINISYNMENPYDCNINRMNSKEFK